MRDADREASPATWWWWVRCWQGSVALADLIAERHHESLLVAVADAIKRVDKEAPVRKKHPW